MAEGQHRRDTQTFKAVLAPSEKCVLVVDDDEAFGRTLRRVLTGAGYAVTAAPNGTAAVEAMMRQSYDIVLSAIEMPGMSGVDLLSIVRAYDLRCPGHPDDA